MAEQRDLPGWPKKKLVAQVRKHLSHYGIRPRWPKLWYETWEWAAQITRSYLFPRWPIPSEIATQYILLLLLDMKANHCLKLPFRAAQQQPPSVQAKLSGSPPALLIEQKEETAG